MSISKTSSLEQVNNGHDTAVAREAEPLGQGEGAAHDALPPYGTESSPARVPSVAQAAAGDEKTERPKNARSTLDVAADEEAFRLRSEGRTFREIAKVMSVDPSVAHRRVKRQLRRQKINLSERLEETRETELEKLRWIEQALLSDAKSGDYTAIKLVLRIMDMRRKYLKDIPPEQAARAVATEDAGQSYIEAIDGKQCGDTGVDVDVAREVFSRLGTESEQPPAMAGVMANMEGATKAPTHEPKRRTKAIVRKSRRKKRSRRK